MMQNSYFFIGGEHGAWRVRSLSAYRGETLPVTATLDVQPATATAPQGAFVLRGLISNIRYAHRSEVVMLRNRQAPLNRLHACHAALIPITKSSAWWELAQDERRAIFEETSHHTAIGSEYLPAVARRLYHCRDLGEPFDFLTWFEYAPEDEAAFNALVARLRATQEWTFVTREVDIRLERA